MTAKTQMPKSKGKAKEEMSLWDKAQLLTPVAGLSGLLDPHEMLMPNERKKNILLAQKKGLIKANVQH